MTDKEIMLAAIGGAWPKEARPRIAFDGKRFALPCTAAYFEDTIAGQDTAAALFRDSGLCWLTSTRYRVQLCDNPGDGDISNTVSLQFGSEWTTRHHTLLAAIDAAIRAVKGATDAQ